MEYNAVFNIDPKQLYLHALAGAINAAAVSNPNGTIKVTTIAQNAAKKIYFEMILDTAGQEMPAITARQLYEYNEKHCVDIVKEYIQAGLIYNAYGYAMHAAMLEMHGEELAAEWLRKWKEGKPAALAIFHAAAQYDPKRGKYLQECLKSLQDLDKEPQPLEEYADTERIKKELEGVLCYALIRPTEPISQPEIDAKALTEFRGEYLCVYARIDIKAFAQEFVTTAGKSGKAAARMLYKLWTNSNITKITKNYKTNKQEPKCKWAKFRNEFTAACGLKIYPYKPNALK